ncbi:MAG TPA: hypothetical protein PLE80_04855 [Opitutaceae bacterium]|nr:hypothetical protein [Opitutaceae bacterium]
MPTPAQDAIKRGFVAHLRVHGETCLFNGTTFLGVLGQLRADDPRMVGVTDSVSLLSVLTEALPSPRPKRGGTIVFAGRDSLRVTQVPRDQPSGITEFVVAK